MINNLLIAIECWCLNYITWQSQLFNTPRPDEPLSATITLHTANITSVEAMEVAACIASFPGLFFKQA